MLPNPCWCGLFAFATPAPAAPACRLLLFVSGRSARLQQQQAPLRRSRARPRRPLAAGAAMRSTASMCEPRTRPPSLSKRRTRAASSHASWPRAASMLAAPRRTLRWHRRLPRAKPPRRPAGMRDEAWAAVPPNGSRRADWLAARGGVAAPSGPVGCWLMRDRGVPAALWEWELAAVRHGHCLPAATPRPS